MPAAAAPAADNTGDRFIAGWLDAWNRHDLEAIMAKYTDDFEFTSPLVRRVGGVASGTLQGKAAIRDYWQVVLAKYPDLHLSLIDATRGVDTLSLYYTARTAGREVRAIETFFFDGTGLVYKAVYTMN